MRTIGFFLLLSLAACGLSHGPADLPEAGADLDADRTDVGTPVVVCCESACASEADGNRCGIGRCSDYPHAVCESEDMEDRCVTYLECDEQSDCPSGQVCRNGPENDDFTCQTPIDCYSETEIRCQYACREDAECPLSAPLCSRLGSLIAGDCAGIGVCWR